MPEIQVHRPFSRDSLIHRILLWLHIKNFIEYEVMNSRTQSDLLLLCKLKLGVDVKLPNRAVTYGEFVNLLVEQSGQAQTVH